MAKTPSITPKQLIKILEERDFVLKRINGSHHYYHNAQNGKITIVPLHVKDLAKGTLHAILKQAGIDKEELF